MIYLIILIKLFISLFIIKLFLGNIVAGQMNIKRGYSSKLVVHVSSFQIKTVYFSCFCTSFVINENII